MYSVVFLTQFWPTCGMVHFTSEGSFHLNNNNNNVIYIAPFTMCSRRLEESRKKMRFKFVFEPVHMIDSTDTARQTIPKMRPSHRKGTIARLFFGTRDLKCNGQIRTETVFSFVDTRLKIWSQITRRTKMESFESLDNDTLMKLRYI